MSEVDETRGSYSRAAQLALFAIIIPFSTLCVGVGVVYAQGDDDIRYLNREDSYEVGKENLLVDVDTSGFSHPDLEYSFGGKKLLDFQPEGAYKVSGSDNLWVFESEVIFDVSLTFATGYNIHDTYPNADAQYRNWRWLTVERCEDYSWWDCRYHTAQGGNCKYHYIDKYDLRFRDYGMHENREAYLGTLAAAGFNGFIPVNFQFKSLEPSSIDFGTTTYKLDTKSFVGEVTDVTIYSASVQDIAPYTTTFESGDDVSDEDTGLQILDFRTGIKRDVTKNAGNGQTALEEKIIALGIGWEPEQPYAVTKQQGTVIGSQTGAVVGQWEDEYAAIRLRLLPDVKLWYQHIDVMATGHEGTTPLRVDTEDGACLLWSCASPAGIENPIPPISDRDTTRTVGWSIKNKEYAVTLHVTGKLYATIELTPEEPDEEDLIDLNSTLFSLDDVIWDASFLGTRNVKLSASETQAAAVSKAIGEALKNFFKNGLYWLVIIAIVVIAIIVLVLVGRFLSSSIISSRARSSGWSTGYQMGGPAGLGFVQTQTPQATQNPAAIAAKRQLRDVLQRNLQGRRL